MCQSMCVNPHGGNDVRRATIVTHFRLDNPLFSHILFPVYVAALLWGALYLRDPRVRALLGPAR